MPRRKCVQRKKRKTCRNKVRYVNVPVPIKVNEQNTKDKILIEELSKKAKDYQRQITEKIEMNENCDKLLNEYKSSISKCEAQLNETKNKFLSSDKNYKNLVVTYDLQTQVLNNSIEQNKDLAEKNDTLIGITKSNQQKNQELRNQLAELESNIKKLEQEVEEYKQLKTTIDSKNKRLERFERIRPASFYTSFGKCKSEMQYLLTL
jgi:chromosome segregation ATPase